MEPSYEQQSWTPTSFDTYRSAIIDEGKLTFSVVTEHLYEGGNTRPDIYFKSKFGEAKYKNTFNCAQRFVLENCDGSFNIKTAVEDYDISLNFILQEHVCGLASKGTRPWQTQDTLENMLNQVHKKRNNVIHNTWPIDEYKLKQELSNLQELYSDILNYVERKTYRSMDSDRSQIVKRLEDKFPDEDDQGRCVGNQFMRRLPNDVQTNYFSSSSTYGGRSNPAAAYRREQDEESDLSTWGKIALGVGAVAAAAAAFGVSKKVENDKRSVQEKRRNQKSSKEDECSIM